MSKSFKGRLLLPKRSSDNWYSRGYVPHLDSDELTQHVSFHLFDSFPQSLLRQWREELQRLQAAGKTPTGQQKSLRIQNALDAGYGCCLLRDDRLAQLIESALLHFDNQRYALHAWCVMPNHVHTLFSPKDGFKMSSIVHSWKSFTAHECNRILGRTGKFWDREPFDRYIRSSRHYRSALAYIENNPVKAGLCKNPEDWRWSSARRR